MKKKAVVANRSTRSEKVGESKDDEELPSNCGLGVSRTQKRRSSGRKLEYKLKERGTFPRYRFSKAEVVKGQGGKDRPHSDRS